MLTSCPRVADVPMQSALDSASSRELAPLQEERGRSGQMHVKQCLEGQLGSSSPAAYYDFDVALAPILTVS